MDNNLQSILNPKSIAVIGACNNINSVGYKVFYNIVEGNYQGLLYPVNPDEKSMRGLRAHPNLAAIPDNIDLAVIAVEPEQVIPAVNQAGEKKVGGIVVLSSGFREIGGQGAEQEKELTELIHRLNIPLIGPNCLGIVNTDPEVRLNASFAEKKPNQGNIAFISQSGAVCSAVLDLADRRNIGFSKFISIGDKADVNEIDLLKALKDDPQTDLILMYLEEITDGAGFIEIAREIAWQARKPILALKSGVSSVENRESGTYTGLLNGMDTAYDAIFMQSGIQRVEEINELFHYAEAFSSQPLPKGASIVIITNAYGPGVMACDTAVRHGLKLASFTEITETKLRVSLPKGARLQNPVNLMSEASPAQYGEVLKTIIDDPGVAGVVSILAPESGADAVETAQAIQKAVKGSDKPVLLSCMGIMDVSDEISFTRKYGMPNYAFPESAMRAMASMVRFSSRVYRSKRKSTYFESDSQKTSNLIKDCLGDRKMVVMDKESAGEVLESYGFPVIRHRIIVNEENIEQAASETGYPCVMKIMSPDIHYKSDIGGVILNINSLAEAKDAYQKLHQQALSYNPNINVDGVSISKMAESGVELIIGGVRDKRFGPMIMFGLGGIFVDTLKDVSFRLAPMWESSAENMIRSIKGYGLLRAIHNRKDSDLEAIKDCILRLAQMMVENPEISELDLDPLIAYPDGKGCLAADSRIILRQPLK